MFGLGRGRWAVSHADTYIDPYFFMGEKHFFFSENLKIFPESGELENLGGDKK